MNRSENRALTAARTRRRFLARFARHRGGVAAVEFALTAPVLLALFFGMSELSDALNADTKMTSVASTAADLVAQDTNICNPEMTEIFSSLNAIMFPYPPNNMKVVVSSLIDAGSGQVKVAWSDAQNTPARAVNSLVTVPSGLVDTGGSVILAEVTYYYSSPTGNLIYGTVALNDKFYEHPRRAETVSRSASC